MMRWLVILICLALVAMCASPVAAQAWRVGSQQGEDQPVSEDEYRQTLQEALKIVGEAQRSNTEASRAPLKLMADRLQAIKSVRLADGQVIVADHSDLAREMRRDEPRLTTLQTRLLALLDAHRVLPAQMSEDDYWQLLSDALARVKQQENAKSPDGSLLADVADRLEGVGWVLLTGGASVPVDNTELVADLRQTNPKWSDLYSLDRRLGALTQAHRDWPRVLPDPSALDKLNQVLARPEFQPQAPQQPSWFEELWERFQRWLNEQLARIGLQDVHLPNLNGVITVVGVLVLAAVIVYFIRTLRANLISDQDFEEAVNGGKLSSSAALKQAQQLAAGSDYRSAVRYLYLAAVLSLDERGLLRFDKALTNREVLRQTSTHAQLKSDLQPVVETFDDVWYGLQPISDEQYREYEQQVARAREIKPE